MATTPGRTEISIYATPAGLSGLEAWAKTLGTGTVECSLVNCIAATSVSSSVLASGRCDVALMLTRAAQWVRSENSRRWTTLLRPLAIRFSATHSRPQFAFEAMRQSASHCVRRKLSTASLSAVLRKSLTLVHELVGSIAVDRILPVDTCSLLVPLSSHHKSRKLFQRGGEKTKRTGQRD